MGKQFFSHVESPRLQCRSGAGRPKYCSIVPQRPPRAPKVDQTHRVRFAPFAVQDVEWQAIAQGQLANHRPVRALPGKRKLDNYAAKLACQLRIKLVFLGVLTHLTNELSGDRLLWMGKDAEYVTFLNNFAIFHYRHAIADFTYHAFHE